jgi:hypothetical protein
VKVAHSGGKGMFAAGVNIGDEIGIGLGFSRLAVAGAAALAVLAAACGSSSDAGAGPLGPVEASGSVCEQGVTSHVFTDGWPFVVNSSQTPAVIDKVGLANPRGLSLITAWAVPQANDGYGAAPGYPQAARMPLSPGLQWAHRHNAVGAIIRYKTHHPYTGMLFVVRLLAKRASATGVDIWYHVGSQHYHLRTVFGLIVLGPGLKCKA